MNIARRIVSATLVIAIMFSVCVSPQASSLTPYSSSAGITETIVIDEIPYIFEYSLEDDTRKIVVTNSLTSQVDVITYNLSSGTLYLNGQIASVIQSTEASSSSARSEAILVSSESHYITWTEGVTAAAVAGLIAGVLGTTASGILAVIGAAGFSALANIAASCIGGTIYAELYLYTAPLAPPQNVLKWTFTANTGESLGPYFSYL